MAAVGRRGARRPARPGGPAGADRAAARRLRRPPPAPSPTCATGPCCGATTRTCTWSEPPATHLGPYPGGLAPPSPRPLTPAEIDTRLAEAGPEARAVVDRLLWNPAGTVNGADRAVTVEGARTPVEQLLARRLLRPAGPDTVLLPREVAWHLRERAVQRRARAQHRTVDLRSAAHPGAGRPRRHRGRVRVGARRRAGRAHPAVHAAPAAAGGRGGGPRRHRTRPGPRHRSPPTPPSCSSAPPRRGCWPSATAAGCCRPSTTTAGPNGSPPIAGAPWPPPGGTPTASPGCPASRAPTPSGPESEAPGAASVRGLLTELLAAVPVGTTVDLVDLQAVVGWHRPRLVRVGGIAAGVRAGLDVARGRLARGQQPGRGVRPGPGRVHRRHPPAAGRAGRRVPGHGRADRAAGGPDRRRARTGALPTGPGAAAAGRPGVPRRRRRVPLQRSVVAAGLRRRLVRGRRAPLAGAPRHHGAAAAAGLPDRRHRPAARQHPGRARQRVRPDRRPGPGRRHPHPPGRERARSAGAGARRPGGRGGAVRGRRLPAPDRAQPGG